MGSEEDIDQLDIKIIKALLRNSRQSFTEIAKECNTSAAAIKKRFLTLMKKEIIVGSTVIADLSNFGVECDAEIFIDANKHEIKQLLRDLKGMPGGLTPYSFKLHSKCNVGAWAPVRSLRDIENLRDSLKRHSFVVDTEIDLWTYMKVYPDNLSLEKRAT
jgi:DNA-binding Lrp family transcriptional regulator